MSMVKRYKDKRTSEKVRRMRGRAAQHQGATSWSEKRDHTSRVSGFFGTPMGQWLKKDGWALIGIVLLVCGSLGYYFFFSAAQRIDSVEVSKTVFIDSEAVKKHVDERLSQKRFLVLPGDSHIALSEGAVAQDVMSAFSENFALESVAVTATGNTLNVDITERVPSVTWVAKGQSKGERVYTVDQNGVVTAELQDRKQANEAYPLVVDRNRDNLGIDWQVVSPEYIAFILDMHSTFTDTTGYEVKQYVMPEVKCHTKEYVAEEVFEKEIAGEESEEVRERKRDIQERFQRGEITIDQSIEMLEQINSEGTQGQDGKKNGSQGDVERIEFEAVNVPTDCDLVKVAHDVHFIVKKPGGEGKFAVYFDTAEPAAKQLQHVLSVIRTQIEDMSLVEYIDVRVPDRVYYR